MGHIQRPSSHRQGVLHLTVQMEIRLMYGIGTTCASCGRGGEEGRQEGEQARGGSQLHGEIAVRGKQTAKQLRGNDRKK